MERTGAIPCVAEAVRPPQYNERPPLLAGYYTYWSDLPMDGRFETYIRARRGFAAAPTHDGLTLTVGGWPYAEFEANKKDVEGHFLKMFDLAPEFAARLHGATRVAPFAGTPVPNFFRKPYGPGWALVGDAGYNKDPITAQGITDAFRDAELCAVALDQAFTGARPFDDAMGEYQRTRDEHVLPMYEFTCQLATHGAAAARDAAVVRRDSREPEGHGRLCPGERGDDLTSEVLLAGKHRRDHGRCACGDVIEAKKASPDDRWQVGDVPTPDLVRSHGPVERGGPRHRRPTQLPSTRTYS